MFLSSENAIKLDNLVKSFEVAYRSYAAKVIINEFPSADEFGERLKNITIEKSSLINSGKYTSSLGSFKKNYKKIFKSLKFSYDSISNFDNVSLFEENEDGVLYVKELIDLIMLLANPTFNSVYTKFETQEQFMYFSQVYKNIRNDVSHPASALIKLEDTKTIIRYIQGLLDIIEDDCFWYSSKQTIKDYIVDISDSISNIPNIITNLNEIVPTHNKIIGRDKELSTLNKWILGEEGSYRTVNSVVAYGYGGIGKTTLIVEFVHLLYKKIVDKEIKYNYMLFFSSKDEKLEFRHTSGNLYIDKIRQQITSFEDFIQSISNYLNINNTVEDIYKYLNQNPGIIIIDNIENLKNKDFLIQFIKGSPRTVHYIVTSRNEEMCEEKLNILGFDEKNNGIEFIDRYILENNLDINLSLSEKKSLLDVSIGNTLILVTSLERIQSRKSSIHVIIDELMNVSSYNTQQIADFMYKNTFNQTLNDLKEYNVEDLLRVIALYEEPIDLYAMSELTEIKIRDLEDMCEILTNKLVLYKVSDLFTLNEFASKFVISKVLPKGIELGSILHKIKKYKTDIKFTLENLESKKNGNDVLKHVMDDWMPKNNTEKLTIANAFSLYNEIERNLKNIKANKRKRSTNKVILQKIEYVENEFIKYELKTPHPYIRYQKARIYKLFLDSKLCGKTLRESIIVKMNMNFDEAKTSVEWYYQYIKNTQSYALFLWLYGVFIKIYKKDFNEAINLFYQSKEIYNKLNIIDFNYLKNCKELMSCYTKKYEETNQVLYLEKATKIYEEVISLKSSSKVKQFDFNRFKKDFNFIVQKI